MNANRPRHIKPSGKVRCSPIVALVLSLVLAAVGGSVCRATDFTIESLPAGSVQSPYALALDCHGDPHVVYADGVADGLLTYASRHNGAWTLESIPGTDEAREPALALDDAGAPHISALDLAAGGIRYITKASGVWTDLHLGGSATGYNSSIAVDPRGRVYISCTDFGQEILTYASNASGPWVIQIVDGGDPVYAGGSSSVALLDHTTPCIAYSVVGAGLRFATRSGSTWSIATVDPTSGIRSASLAFILGTPCISYLDTAQGKLKFATKPASTWVREDVTASVNWNFSASLAVDPQWNPHISYCGPTAGSALRYASKVNGVWTTEQVLASTSTHSSLAIDEFGRPHIAFLRPGGLAQAFVPSPNDNSLVLRGELTFNQLVNPGGGDPTIFARTLNHHNGFEVRFDDVCFRHRWGEHSDTTWMHAGSICFRFTGPDANLLNCNAGQLFNHGGLQNGAYLQVYATDGIPSCTRVRFRIESDPSACGAPGPALEINNCDPSTIIPINPNRFFNLTQFTATEGTYTLYDYPCPAGSQQYVQGGPGQMRMRECITVPQGLAARDSRPVYGAPLSLVNCLPMHLRRIFLKKMRFDDDGDWLTRGDIFVIAASMANHQDMSPIMVLPDNRVMKLRHSRPRCTDSADCVDSNDDDECRWKYPGRHVKSTPNYDPAFLWGDHGLDPSDVDVRFFVEEFDRLGTSGFNLWKTTRDRIGTVRRDIDDCIIPHNIPPQWCTNAAVSTEIAVNSMDAAGGRECDILGCTGPSLLITPGQFHPAPSHDGCVGFDLPRLDNGTFLHFNDAFAELTLTNDETGHGCVWDYGLSARPGAQPTSTNDFWDLVHFQYGQISHNELKFWAEMSGPGLRDPASFIGTREFQYAIDSDAHLDTGCPFAPLCGADCMVSIFQTSDGNTITTTDTLFCWTAESCCFDTDVAPSWVSQCGSPYGLQLGNQRNSVIVPLDAIGDPQVGRNLSAWLVLKRDGLVWATAPEDVCQTRMTISRDQDRVCPEVQASTFTGPGDDVDRITIEFTEPMQPIDPLTQILLTPNVPCSASLDATKKILTIVPNNPPFPPGYYHLELAGSIRDLANNFLRGTLQGQCGDPAELEFCVSDSRFYATDAAGVEKVLFAQGEAIRVSSTGSQFPNGTSFFLYLVLEDDLDTEGTLLVDQTVDGRTLTFTNNSNLNQVNIGAALHGGDYSIVADINHDGRLQYTDRIIGTCDPGISVQPPCGNLLRDDPLAWWTLDEVPYEGQGASADLVDGHHGTHSGSPATVVGKVSNGLTFNGSSYIIVPDHHDLDIGTGDFSVMCWLRTTATGVRSILDKRDTTLGWHLALVNGQVTVNLNVPGGYTNYPSVATVNDGQWHHIAAVVDRDDPSGLRIYIDGRLDATRNPTGRQGDLSSTADLWIGGHHSSPTSHFIGTLDEVILFDKVLDQQRIQFYYQAGLEGKRCVEQATSVESEQTPPPLTAPIFPGVQNLPNPFVSGTTIRFELQRQSAVQVDILDVSGRLVKSVVNQRMEAGNHSVDWDGTDDSGVRLPAGVYFWQFRSEDRKMAQKMVMLK